MLLCDLPLSNSGIIAEILPECKGPQRNRLLDLGFTPGARVIAEMRSPSGEPTAYRIKNTLIAIRREQAAMIRLQDTELSE
ncbi:hypothetical protein MASR2M18_08230 [Ignavibacteria bacterium]|nr:ferrous iron transport protein A [Bacteroidota bacterium]MCZ2133710.1 ferrous iron transport protein A [Bacteroidota bacterium]